MSTLFEDLVRMDLQSLARWIRSESGNADLVQQEGRGLVEVFAGRLLEEAEVVRPNEWDGLSEALDKAMVLAGIDRTESAIRRLNLMSALVAVVGPSCEHSLRNPNAAVAVFIDALPMDFNEASMLTVDWRRESRENIRRLRFIRNLLAPLVGIERLVSDAAGRETIGKWMTLFDRLP